MEFITVDIFILLKYTPVEMKGKMNSRPLANKKEKRNAGPETA
jgi:hypothetical protein